MDTNIHSSYSRTSDSDRTLGNSMSPTSPVPSGSAGHSDQPGSSGSIALRQQHGFRRQPKPWTSTWFSVITRAMDINTDPGCSGILAPDMTFGSIMDLDITMGSDGSVGHSHPGPHCCHISGSASLYSAHTTLLLCLSLLTITEFLPLQQGGGWALNLII